MLKLFSTFGIVLMLMSAGVVRAEDQKDASGNKEDQSRGIIVQLGDDGEAKAIRTKLGDYWLGLAVQPLGQEDRKDLKIEGEGGLVVQQVLPEGPAAKAGIKQQDVVTKADDKVLKQAGDLVDTVNAAKDKAVKLEVTRDGKSLTVEVTPEKRKALSGLLPPADGQQIQEWMEKIQKEMAEGKTGGPFRFHVFRPGTILPPDVLIQRGLPDDMTVVVTRTGKKPAKVVIEQGEKRWEATEDNLGELPKEVRPYVEGMLGRMPIMGMTENMRFESPADGARRAPDAERPAHRLENRIERRLDEMNQRLEKLNKAVEDMRATKSPRKAKTIDKSEGKQPQEAQQDVEK